jgi:hypothetical protein
VTHCEHDHRRSLSVSHQPNRIDMREFTHTCPTALSTVRRKVTGSELSLTATFSTTCGTRGRPHCSGGYAYHDDRRVCMRNFRVVLQYSLFAIENFTMTLITFDSPKPDHYAARGLVCVQQVRRSA